MTVELLLSDLQIGKLGPGYNTQVARKRLYEYGRAACFKIEQQQSLGYRVERIVLAIIGDIIESDKKHKNSARATDTGTAEQIYDALEGLFEFVIEPLAKLGITLDIIGVTGNHDHDDHGINMFEPGKAHLSWPLYKGLELLSRRAGYTNVSWDIPDGSYAIASIYGQNVLYEHGVGVSVSESAMKAHKIKRAEQEKTHIRYFRMGDKHTVTSFNAGSMVVNGAFFGATKGGQEYSGIAGFDSIPAQWMGFHVQRDDARLSLYDTFIIQLEHITA
ncbi:exonuclease [Caulobacter phage Lullwater]|uniref:Metallo-dependent phosphatase n=1 Tax=Caulobacter phage Lullwater TaxID=2024607 RepID=A0A291LC20_9CAUD|nr:exonuclease [Caulobacter phage Lullwater]ATI16329.1 metallo-dependent phosphatase [Caulobacter phage Lullwater]